MRIASTLILPLCLSMFCCLQSACSQVSDPITVTEEGLLEDLIFLKEKILKTHPNPFYLTTKEEFNSKIQHLLNNKGRYEVEEIYVRMLEIVASVGDGHTNLRPFEYYNDYPLRFYWLQDNIYISGISKDQKTLLGSKLVAVDGIPIEDVMSKVFNLIPGHESKTFSRDWATYYVRIAEIMYGLGICSSKKSIVYKIETPSGEHIELPFKIEPANGEIEIVRPYEKAPMYYDEKENGLWFRELDHNLIYFHFSDYPRKSEFKKLGKNLNKLLGKSVDKTLLIDLRRNGGGDFTKGRKLIELIEKTVIKNKIPVYVAIGGSTYSAAVANAVDFKKRLNATLLGEVTAGRPNGYQENNAFVLPNTKIPGSCSSEYYKFQEEDTPGLFPDVEIKFMWEHYAKSQDVVLDYLYGELERFE